MVVVVVFRLRIEKLNFVTIALHFIQADHMRNWQPHLDSIKSMLPIFHDNVHVFHANSCQLYLRDMDSLHLKMTKTEFYTFTTRRKAFSQLDVQTNFIQGYGRTR